MQENPTKVLNKIQELNSASPPSQKKWEALNGFNAITGFNFNPTGQANFNPSFGYPVKVFVNNATGEVKIYSAYLFIN